jgi:hypothetical protein
LGHIKKRRFEQSASGGHVEKQAANAATQTAKKIACRSSKISIYL